MNSRMQPRRVGRWLSWLACVAGLLAGAAPLMAQDAPAAAPAQTAATPAAEGKDAPAAAAAPSAAPAADDANPLPLTLDDVFKPKDRVLFIGDDVTQQMFFTRAVAAAILPLRPNHDLRFFNGGKDGATAANVTRWVDEVLKLAEPTVVFIGLGLNDIPTPPLSQEQLTQFQRNLAALVDKVRTSSQVRLVVLMSPPPLERGMVEELQPDNMNHVLGTLGDAVRVVAARRQTGFIDLYEQLAKVYLGKAQRTAADDPLSLGGRLPTELGHMILASSVLQGVGVRESELDEVGWSPMLPREMSRVRGVMAIKTKSPALPLAVRSRELYLQIFRFDEQFFRLWRLAGRPRPSSPDPVQVRAQAEDAWAVVREIVSAPVK